MTKRQNLVKSGKVEFTTQPLGILSRGEGTKGHCQEIRNEFVGLFFLNVVIFDRKREI